VPGSLPVVLADVASASAAPHAVDVAFARLADERPEAFDRLTDDGRATSLATTLAAVAAASNVLGRLCVVDPAALDVLESLERPVPIGADSPETMARAKRLELLRIAARDLLGADRLETVGSNLASLASDVLEASVALSSDGAGQMLAVIGMGKLGGEELNYASDVDVLFVGGESPDDAPARRVLEAAGRAFRVDAALRPEGRAGALVRSLSGYTSYWERWARPWEFQALLKARAVAGDADLGRRFESAAGEEVWGRGFGAEELAEVRRLKARAESQVERRGMAGRELKRGPGGIRDIEFAVQLLQLVHGRLDPGIRDRSTLGAVAQLAAAGYIDPDDAAVLERAYRFLRTVEHRLQLIEEEQVHAVPAEPEARRRVALVLGFEDDSEATATDRFDESLRSCLADVRGIHERLFFRPLLEAFARLEPSPRSDAVSSAPGGDAVSSAPGGVAVSPAPRDAMSAEAVATRLAAFGFAGAERTRAAVTELAGGLTRSSRLMDQMLPLLLDWLSLSPDPDLGLLGLRNLVVHPHHRAVLVSTFRESPEAARRLCLLLGTSRVLGEAVGRNPDLIATLDDDEALAPSDRVALAGEALERVRMRDPEFTRPERWRAQLVRLRQEQHVGIGMLDLLGKSDVASIGKALTGLSEGLLEAAVASVDPGVPLCVVGMGRLGGAELSYASDLDLVFVVGDDIAPERAEAAVEALVRLLRGDSPAERVATIDLGLRPEGAQGRMARDLRAYATYFERWGQTWERQALLRARVVAGDRRLGDLFMSLAEQFVWAPGLDDADVAAIRRMKARIERERIPAHEDPQFHLKLGRGSLTDIEWTVQLLQWRHGIRDTGTMDALEALAAGGRINGADHVALAESYRFCEHARNRWYLIGALPGGASPGDAFPMQADQLGRLARSLGTTPASLRDDYRRVTRRARRVVERLFYGIDPP
jgi:glutamate-ammonia-ligase adenylyltransferase